ncbi:MAG: hypothetical protein JSU72_09515 [Deltaproteobacteria bacterium]|nr:MAG: hypothetical protein JSU72_09515 [Deltaproteobacteria bacterium]
MLTEPKPDKENDKDEPKSESSALDKIHFDIKPEELEAYLGEYVIKQEEAKAILATRVCTHFNRLKQEPKAVLRRLLENPDDPELLTRYYTAFSQDKAAVTQAVLGREAYYREKYGPAVTEPRIDLVVTSHLLSGIPVEDLFGQVVSMINEVKAFERNFMATYKISIHFLEEAIDEILRIAISEDKDVETICRRASKDYDYAVKLVVDKTGQQEVVIAKQAILDPDTFTNELIQRSNRPGQLGIPSVPSK